jgi:inosine/xanthosine triphosphate pyrophosphatase family protein
MQLLLGITRSRYDIGAPGYIRVLGFSEKGRRLLAEMRDEEKNAISHRANALTLLLSKI